MLIAGQTVSTKLQQEVIICRGSVHEDSSQLNQLILTAAGAVCFGHVLDAGLTKCLWKTVHALQRSQRSDKSLLGPSFPQTELAWWALCMGGGLRPEHAHATAGQLGILESSPQKVLQISSDMHHLKKIRLCSSTASQAFP